MAPGACAHCDLPVPPGSPDAEFCCAGCRVVHGLLNDGGLQRFYSLGGGAGQPVGRVPEVRRRDWLDEAVAAGSLGGGQTHLRLDVQGIHCSACVWLLSELWRRRAGARQIDINPGLGQARLIFDTGFDVAAYLDEIERFGYRVAPASERSTSEESGLLLRLGVCTALALNAMMFAFAGYLGLDATAGVVYVLFRWLSFGFATLAVLVGGSVFFRAALGGLGRRVLHLDLPISLGIALAYGGSSWQLLSGAGDGYFDTVTVFIALMLAGRYVQRRAVARNRAYLLANTGVELLRARVVRDGGVQSVPLTALAAGDRLLLSPGDLVPMDVRLLDRGGSFSLDWISGESRPAHRPAGAVVQAGAFLRSQQALLAEVVRDVETSGLPQLLATPARCRDERATGGFWAFLNRAYAALVLVLAGLAALTWALIEPGRALEVAVSVLVVTCPCALGLATPLAFDLALAGLRSAGVYVRTSSLLERARAVRRVVFDKTGTLTWGALRATVLRGPQAGVRDVLLTMAASSRHPVSESVTAALGEGGFRLLPGLRVREVRGKGLVARYDGAEYRLGSRGFVFGEDEREADRGMCLFTRDRQVVEACFGIEEDVRCGFGEEIRGLQAAGIDVHILSGDGQRRVDAVASSVGVAPDFARGACSPEDKADRIRALGAESTMMIGDGINDAPAFDAAGCAGAAALDRPVMPARADFFFLGGGSAAVRQVLQAAARLDRVVRANLWLAAGYNAAALALCFAGVMTPLLCAALMPLSSLALIWHTALRLRRRDARAARGRA